MKRIFIYGTGNMAWALTQAFREAGTEVAGVLGHSPENTRAFAEQAGVPLFTDLSTETAPGDYVFLAIKDDALPLLNQTLRLPGRVVLHTAGSVCMEAIAAISETVGVFYPLQRVQKFKPPQFAHIPICIEASHLELLDDLRALASGLSSRVLVMDSRQRQKVHLAAVFVNNFANFMWVMGNEVLRENGLPSDLLDALLQDTVAQADLGKADERQTGPARRGDLKVIQSHLQLLKDHPRQEALYRLLSFEILKHYNNPT